MLLLLLRLRLPGPVVPTTTTPLRIPKPMLSAHPPMLLTGQALSLTTHNLPMARKHNSNITTTLCWIACPTSTGLPKRNS